MKKFEFITQWLSLSFVVLLLTASVTCGSFSIPGEFKNDRVSHLLSKEKSLKDTSSDEVPVISELKLNAVVTHFSSFDFDKAFFQIVHEWIPARLKTVIPLAFSIPHYYLQFFRYVFGHHIAINAP